MMFLLSSHSDLLYLPPPFPTRLSLFLFASLPQSLIHLSACCPSVLVLHIICIMVIKNFVLFYFPCFPVCVSTSPDFHNCINMNNLLDFLSCFSGSPSMFNLYIPYMAKNTWTPEHYVVENLIPKSQVLLL